MVKDTWGTDLTDSTIKQNGWVGFVYIITEVKKPHRKYVGIKKFFTKKSKPTNWRNYVSSSGKLKGLDINNKRKFNKEIIMYCSSITHMKTNEAYIQLSYYMDGKWDELFNEMINIRLRIRK